MFFKEYLSVDDVIAYVESETGYTIEFEDLQALEREGAIKPVVYLRNIYFDLDFSGFTLDIDKKFISSAYYEPVDFVLLDTIVYNPYREYNDTYLGIESWSHFKLVKIVEGGIDCPDIDAEGLLNIHYQSSAGVGELTSLNEIVYSAIFFRRAEIEQVFHIENKKRESEDIQLLKQQVRELEQQLDEQQKAPQRARAQTDETNTDKKLIAMLAILLAKQSNTFRIGDRPNAKQINEQVYNLTMQIVNELGMNENDIIGLRASHDKISKAVQAYADMFKLSKN